MGGPQAAPPPPPAPPKLGNDPIQDNAAYYNYMTALYTYSLGISMFETYRQTSGKLAVESKKLLEFCPLSGH